MTLTITTPPALEPITLDQAKAQLRVTLDAEDDLIAALITAARQRVEVELGLALICTGFRESFDAAPEGPIALSRAPLIAVSSVAVADASGAYNTVSPSAYLPRIGAREAQIAPVDLVWPTPIPPIDGLRADYTAGFGDTADDAPGPIKQAILALVAYAFDHRSEPDTAPLSLVEPWLAPYRRVRL